MKSFCLILFYSFLPTLLNQDQVSSVSAYILTPSQSIKDGETLTSHSETFELGFFSPSSNSKNRYLGMWYKKVPVQTVVWVANRDSPLNDSSGVLTLSAEGNLVILNKTNRSIKSKDSSKTAANPIVEFLESGNLVLRDQNSSDEYLWQSFDHPSDTLLPGMKIGWDSSVGQNRHLTSWKSLDDPSLGDFTFGIDLTPYPELVVKNGANKYYRSGPWNGLRLSGQAGLTSRITFVYQVVSVTFQLDKQDVFTRLILKQNGD